MFHKHSPLSKHNKKKELFKTGTAEAETLMSNFSKTVINLSQSGL